MWILRFLTCALPAKKIFALRLIGVNGSDRNVIKSVRLQVLQNGSGVLIAQDILRKSVVLDAFSTVHLLTLPILRYKQHITVA